MDLKNAMTRLGFWGLAPFAAAAAGVWLSPTFVPAGLAYDLGEIALLYAAVIASYLAGAGAGGLLARGSGGEGLAPGMIAALILWVNAWPQGALFISLPSAARYLIAIAIFIYLYLRDRNAVAAGLLPDWYGVLRIRLTFWACLMLGAILGRLLV